MTKAVKVDKDLQLGEVSAGQLRAARALLGLGQPDVAAAARVSTMTLRRAERAAKPAASADAVERIKAALQAAGVIFVEENGDGPGVRLRKARKR